MSLCMLIARQRSGTGALGSLLDQHKDIKYLGEVFHNDAINNEPNYFNFLQGLIAQDNLFGLPGNAEGKLDKYIEYLNGYSVKNNKIIDVKYRSLHHFNGYWHGPTDCPVIVDLARKINLPIIHLTRNNLLKTYISGQLADINSVWHARDKSELKIETVTLDVNKTLSWLNNIDYEVEKMRFFLRNYSNVIHIEYEQLFRSNGVLTDVVSKKIETLLNVTDVEEAKSVFVKQASDNLEKVIENYREVEFKLSNTKFSWMMY